MVLNESMGIAIGAKDLSMAYMKATPLGVRLVSQETFALDPAYVNNGDLKETRTKIYNFMDRHGARNACINIGLPSDQYILRTIELPQAAKENLRQTITYELTKYLPLNADELYYDFQTLSESRRSKSMEIIIVAAKKSALAPILESDDTLANGLCGIETLASAWINGLQWFASPESNTYLAALIDDHSCRLAMMDNGQLKGAASAHLKGNHQNRSQQILDAGQQFHRHVTANNGATNLYCFGPGATDSLVKELQGTSQWNIQSLDLTPQSSPNEQLLSAVGLALKGIQSVTLDINLMPPQMRKKPSRSGQLLSAILIALVVISACGWAGRTVFSAKNELAQLDQQIEQLTEQVRSIEQIQTNIETLERQLESARSLQATPETNTLAILKELSRVIPTTAWIRDLNIKGDQTRIDGYADDSAQLIPILDQSPLFTNVTILSTITKGRDGKERFRIGFDISQPSEKPN